MKYETIQERISDFMEMLDQLDDEAISMDWEKMNRMATVILHSKVALEELSGALVEWK